jgi:riboflavin kinase / FMN adenylyltransferase
MRVFDSFDLPEKPENLVVTIGNYDGIHIGHRAIIERVKEHAEAMQGTSAMITFHPHPVHLLRPEQELAAISTPEEKRALIEDTGIDILFDIPFTPKFSQINPQMFVTLILVEKLNVKGVVVGYDFRFGRGGEGDTSLLEKLGCIHGFFVEEIGVITMDGEKIGSNRIRKLVKEGNVADACRVLGRPYSIAGTVIRAKGRGHTIVGYPTINLLTEHTLIPKNGVYITEVEFEGNHYGSVTNVGYNPTFETGQNRSIETFILDYEGDLYDKDVRISFRERIRDEERFSGVEELKARIAQDVEIARKYLAKAGPGRYCADLQPTGYAQ